MYDTLMNTAADMKLNYSLNTNLLIDNHRKLTIEHIF